MMKIWLSCCTAILLIGNLFAQEEFTKYLDAFAKAGTILAPPPEGKVVDDKLLSQLQQELEQIRFPSELQPEMDLMQLRILYAQGKYQEVIDLVESQSQKYQTMMPDWLLWENYCYIKINNQYNNDVSLKIANVIPFAYFGYNRDEILGKPRIRFSFIPLNYGTNAKQFLRVANLFKQENAPKEYVDNSLMFLYGHEQPDYLVDRVSKKYKNSIWRKIGQAERAQGHEKLAKIAYLRAAFEAPGSLETLKQDWNSFVPLQESPQKIPKRLAIEIATIYGSQQLYPWALEILRRSDDDCRELYDYKKEEFIQMVTLAYKQNSTAYVMGIPASEITDFDNFHLAKPSETFWNEETLYVPKEEIVSK